MESKINITDRLFMDSYKQTFNGTPKETLQVMDNCERCINQLLSRERINVLQPGFSLTIYGYFDTLKGDIDINFLNQLFLPYGGPFNKEQYSMLQECINTTKFPPPKNNGYTTQYSINITKAGDVQWTDCNGINVRYFNEGDNKLEGFILIDSVIPCQSKCESGPATIGEIVNTGQKTICTTPTPDITSTRLMPTPTPIPQ
jgi:hypothetical protein